MHGGAGQRPSGRANPAPAAQSRLAKPAMPLPSARVRPAVCAGGGFRSCRGGVGERRGFGRSRGAGQVSTSAPRPEPIYLVGGAGFTGPVGGTGTRISPTLSGSPPRTAPRVLPAVAAITVDVPPIILHPLDDLRTRELVVLPDHLARAGVLVAAVARDRERAAAIVVYVDVLERFAVRVEDVSTAAERNARWQTRPHSAVWAPTSSYAARARRWHLGHENDDRFMNGSLRIGDPHRRHGIPSWPYASSERSKYPDCPFTFT